jgi:hypothetical protein
MGGTSIGDSSTASGVVWAWWVAKRRVVVNARSVFAGKAGARLK